MKTRKERKKQLALKREFRSLDRQLNKYINEHTNSVSKYVEIAAEAKRNGLNDQYKKALSGIQLSMNMRLKYISTKMDLKMSFELGNTVHFMKDFSDTMNRWSKTIRKISKDFDVDALQDNIDEAMDTIGEVSEEMDSVQESMSNNYGNLLNKNSKDYVSIDTAEKIVDDYIVHKSQNSSINLDAMLKELEKREEKNE